MSKGVKLPNIVITLHLTPHPPTHHHITTTHAPTHTPIHPCMTHAHQPQPHFNLILTPPNLLTSATHYTTAICFFFTASPDPWQNNVYRQNQQHRGYQSTIKWLGTKILLGGKILCFSKTNFFLLSLEILVTKRDRGTWM